METEEIRNKLIIAYLIRNEVIAYLRDMIKKESDALNRAAVTGDLEVIKAVKGRLDDFIDGLIYALAKKTA